MASSNASPRHGEKAVTMMGRTDSPGMPVDIPNVDAQENELRPIADGGHAQGDGQSKLDGATGSTISLSESGAEEQLPGNGHVILDRENESQRILRGIQLLGIDLPQCLIAKVAASYTGRGPMERFLAETYNAHGGVPDIDGSNEEETSSCYATIGSSKERGISNS